MLKKKYKNKQPKKDAYFALMIATTTLAINFWAWSLLSPIGFGLAKDLQLTPVMLSILLAVPVIIGSLGRIFIGMLTDRFGGRMMFVVVSIVTAVSVFLLTFAGDYKQYLLSATLIGFGGTAFVVGIPFVSTWFPASRRGLVLGIYSMGNAGTALSGFATPWLVNNFGYDKAYIFVASLIVLLAMIFVCWGKNAPGWKPAKMSPATRLLSVAKLSFTWDLSIVYAVTFGALIALGVYLPTLLKTIYNLSVVDSALRAGGFVLLATTARPLGGWLSDKFGGKLVIQVALFCIVLLSILVAFQPTLQLQTTVGYLALAFTLGCANGAVFALVGKLTKPEAMGSITGIIGSAGGFGGFIPPILLGLTYQYTNSYAFALTLLGLSALFVLLFITKRFKNNKIYYCT